MSILIIISLAFLGGLQIYAFFETVYCKQSEHQCFQFAICIYGAMLEFQTYT